MQTPPFGGRPIGPRADVLRQQRGSRVENLPQDSWPDPGSSPVSLGSPFWWLTRKGRPPPSRPLPFASRPRGSLGYPVRVASPDRNGQGDDYACSRYSLSGAYRASAANRVQPKRRPANSTRRHSQQRAGARLTERLRSLPDERGRGYRIQASGVFGRQRNAAADGR